MNFSTPLTWCFTAHTQEQEHRIIIPWWRHCSPAPALPMAPRYSEAGRLLALETCFPLQRTVVFCSLLLEAQLVPACTSLQRRLLPALHPQSKPRPGGFSLRWSLPVLSSPAPACPQLLSGHEENLTWIGFGCINNCPSFISLPVLIGTSLSPSQSLSTSPAANLCSLTLDGQSVSCQALTDFLSVDRPGSEQKARLRREPWSFILERGTQCPCTHCYTVFLEGTLLTSSSTDNTERFPSGSCCWRDKNESIFGICFLAYTGLFCPFLDNMHFSPFSLWYPKGKWW